MAKKILTIRIETEDGKETITISDDFGNSKEVRGVMVVGADSLGQDFYMAAAGNAKETAFAFGEGLARGTYQEQFTGDNWYTVFYQALLKEMCRRTGEGLKNEITAEEAEKKFGSDVCNCPNGQCNCRNKKTFH